MGQNRPPLAVSYALEFFKGLKDPRIARTQLHSLQNLLVMSLCGSICGTEGWDQLVDFCRIRSSWFATFLDMPNGVPSADTFRRLYERLSPRQFQECFTNWVAALARDVSGEIVAIDGKTLRGLVEKAGKKTQLHMVHVWAADQGLLLGQEVVDGASGEMAAVPRLLELLDLEGAIITTDANSCTAPVTRAIVESGADFVLAVKGNRGRFHDFVVEAMKTRQVLHTFTEVDESHGRKEVRTVSVIEIDDWPERTKNNGAWAGLRTAVMVERKRKVGGEATTKETQYYVSSLGPDAEKNAHAVRSHWSVENNLHWVLDVGFGDDRRNIRNATSAENVAILDRIALTLVKRDTSRKRGVAAKRKIAGWDPDYLGLVLTSGIPIP